MSNDKPQAGNRHRAFRGAKGGRQGAFEEKIGASKRHDRALQTGISVFGVSFPYRRERQYDSTCGSLA
jgi:hypothetical protein